jgi:nickel-dependent lactate racemase
MLSQIFSPTDSRLSDEAILQTLRRGLEGRFSGQRVLVLIPDHTRSLPTPLLFRGLAGLLQDARQLDVMVALGTHPALSPLQLERLVGITPDERRTTFRHIGLFNHAWDSPQELTRLGVVPAGEVRRIAAERWHPSLPGDVEVRIHKAALEHDQVLIVGPVFPHEVVGFSGGAKYLFPGISGPEMIHATHWLGALSGVVGTIGIKDTPVRALIHAAAALLPTPVTVAALVVEGESPTGLFIGDPLEAWSAAADLSAQRHIRWCPEPFRQVLSCAPPMYDELWTAGKAMYKLEPVVASGGELIIYAPHLEEVSRVHGRYIYETGYHTLPYFLAQWERFKHIPLGVLAHSTHVRGSGRMENGREIPSVQVTLASKIPPEDCARLNLGYRDPATIDARQWQDRQDEGILYVPRAGEILYRLEQDRSGGPG